ncbi:hypothetical protein F5ESL0260_03800 [Lactobacillus sp. ESL0260]|uniref:sigma factor-like helix-turn-helix DNA-binding protein n=1 Tax=Lactobacillus sp. ESL0260 TaxID=2069347 RepID=UPI000EFC7C26|nr:sigma factor-like helix-turn-helix DNA-binding protein [Lactobacillus sp. ESL0260]RMC57946.1 hypothetical protein F5ESL0260_03800 [Lactobacillus sp. ESL0260]
MKKSNKIEHLNAFEKLDERRKKAIRMVFERKYTEKEIAERVGRKRPTINLWK